MSQGEDDDLQTPMASNLGTQARLLLPMHTVQQNHLVNKKEEHMKEALKLEMVGLRPEKDAPKDKRILFLPKKHRVTDVQEPINICWWSEKHNGWMSDLCLGFGGTEEMEGWLPLPEITNIKEST